jgi:NAD(P)H-flavin reductase
LQFDFEFYIHTPLLQPSHFTLHSYKKRLASLEEGTKVKVRGPQGKLVLHEDYSKPAVFLSGGDKQLHIKIVMFDSNRNQENTLFKKEFDEYVNINRNLKIIYTITEEEEEEEKKQGDKPSQTNFFSNILPSIHC